MASNVDHTSSPKVTELNTKLEELRKEIVDVNERYDQYNEQYQTQLEKIRRLTSASEAHTSMMKMIQEHQQLNESLKIKCLPYEVPTMDSYRTSLQAKSDVLAVKREKLEGSLKQSKAGLKQLERELNHLKPRLHELESQREEAISTLLSLGVSIDEIGTFHRGSISKFNNIPSGDFISPAVGHSRSDCNYVTIAQTKPSNRHSDVSTWFLHGCTREEARNLLKGRSNGTFLIRTSQDPNIPYALSIAMDGKVYHCPIQRENDFLGFSKPFIVHNDLQSLVLYYQRHSLEQFNPVLKTCLSTPVQLL